MAKTVTSTDADCLGKPLSEIAKTDGNGHPKRVSHAPVRQGAMARVIQVSKRPAISLANSIHNAGSEVYLTITDGEGNSNRVLKRVYAYNNLKVIYVDDIGYHIGDIVEYTVSDAIGRMTYESKSTSSSR